MKASKIMDNYPRVRMILNLKKQNLIDNIVLTESRAKFRHISVSFLN